MKEELFALPPIVAHRGGACEQVENTMSAFANCYAAGFRRFEIDLRLTADKQVVVFHDPTLERMTEGEGSLSRVTADELAAIPMRGTSERVPSFETMAAFMADHPDTWFLIEVKGEKDNPGYSPECARLAFEIIQQHDIAPERAVFISFQLAALREVRRLAPAWPLGILKSVLTEQTFEEATELQAEWLLPEINVTTRSFIRQARKAGFKTGIWTAQTAADAVLVQALEADVVISDIPQYQLDTGSGVL